MKEEGERASDWQGRVHGHARQLDGERREVVDFASPCALRERANALDAVEELSPLECAQRLPEQLSEQADVVTKRLVRIVAHADSRLLRGPRQHHRDY